MNEEMKQLLQERKDLAEMITDLWQRIRECQEEINQDKESKK